MSKHISAKETFAEAIVYTRDLGGILGDVTSRAMPPTCDPGQGQPAVVAASIKCWESPGGNEPVRPIQQLTTVVGGYSHKRMLQPPRLPDLRSYLLSGHRNCSK